MISVGNNKTVITYDRDSHIDYVFLEILDNFVEKKLNVFDSANHDPKLEELYSKLENLGFDIRKYIEEKQEESD